jgi:hypothetical protein
MPVALPTPPAAWRGFQRIGHSLNGAEDIGSFPLAPLPILDHRR